MGFKVGDRAECTTARRTAGNRKLLGEKGTIIKIRHGKIYAMFAVEFDNKILGHDCGGIGKQGHCYWLDEYDIADLCWEKTMETIPEPQPTNYEIKSDQGKPRLHTDICKSLNDIYISKNADYGDSFAKLRQEIPEAILVRIYDKYSRLKTLL